VIYYNFIRLTIFSGFKKCKERWDGKEILITRGKRRK